LSVTFIMRPSLMRAASSVENIRVNNQVKFDNKNEVISYFSVWTPIRFDTTPRVDACHFRVIYQQTSKNQIFSRPWWHKYK
jgi:hypothetical protein